MTPAQKIKWAILLRIAEWRKEPTQDITCGNVDDLYESLEITGDHWDAKNEIRASGVNTGLPCEYSRHYESDAVAAKMPDGSWVGWTYWHGGGKHSEPEAIDWIEDAYDLKCVEEEKVVVVRTFSKADGAAMTE